MVSIIFCLFLSNAQAQDFKRLNPHESGASSFLQSNWNRYQENYHPNYAFDDNAKTAWVEGADGDGIGESLIWPVSPLASASLVKLKIRNGYQKSKSLFEANSSVKEAEITFLGANDEAVFTKNITLKNELGWQEFIFEIPKQLGFARISMKINAVYPGKTYRDTCISDIQTFVISTVPHNEVVEDAKIKQLLKWTKDRVKDAAYFAKLPVEYPFASTSFEEKNHFKQELPGNVMEMIEKDKLSNSAKKAISPEKAKLAVQLFQKMKEVKDLKLFYTLSKDAKSKKIVYPDINTSYEFWSSYFKFPEQELLPFLYLAGLTFSETKAATGKMTTSEYLTTRVASNYTVQWADTAKKIPAYVYLWEKQAFQERGVSESEKHILLAFESGKLKNVLEVGWFKDISNVENIKDLKNKAVSEIKTQSLKDLTSLSLASFDYNAQNKIQVLEMFTANHQEYDGGTNDVRFVKHVAKETRPLNASR